MATVPFIDHKEWQTDRQTDLRDVLLLGSQTSSVKTDPLTLNFKSRKVFSISNTSECDSPSCTLRGYQWTVLTFQGTKCHFKLALCIQNRKRKLPEHCQFECLGYAAKFYTAVSRAHLFMAVHGGVMQWCVILEPLHVNIGPCLQ